MELRLSDPAQNLSIHRAHASINQSILFPLCVVVIQTNYDTEYLGYKSTGKLILYMTKSSELSQSFTVNSKYIAATLLSYLGKSGVSLANTSAVVKI